MAMAGIHPLDAVLASRESWHCPRAARRHSPDPQSPMKTKLLALLLLAPAALLGAAFEGKVNFKISANRGPTEQIGYHVKGGKIRIEVAGQTELGGFILDVAKKQTLVIMDAQRMYMVMEMPDVAAQAAAAKPGEATLEKTGERQKILGFEATKYLSTYQGKKTELWLAEGLGKFMSMESVNPMGGGARGGAGGQPWERALAAQELFPLRVVTFDAGGKEEFRLEATAVEKKSLPDSLFTPPAGYQPIEMGGMMKGMMPGGFPGMKP
jgi:hypothetical protein